MKILSVIIPAYNSERFLQKALDSLLREEVLAALDIIVVDDGSTDRTPEIARDYCLRYSGSVRLIRQENRGHGGALNTGCAAAVGKYLKVIDADDWVNSASLPEFIRLLGTCRSDVVLTHYHTVDISTGQVKNWKSYPERFGRAYTMGQIMAQWKAFDRVLTFHGITYRRDFYERFGMELSCHVFYEDHEFATFPCCRAASVTPFDLYVYEYRVGDMEQSVSQENQLKRLGDTEAVLGRMAEEYRKLTPAASKAYVRMKLRGLLISYLTTALLSDPDKARGRRKARAMMALLPEVWHLTRGPYRMLSLLNRLHVSRGCFERVIGSKCYNALRRNHDFI